jgi:hypothetical protein
MPAPPPEKCVTLVVVKWTVDTGSGQMLTSDPIEKKWFGEHTAGEGRAYLTLVCR